MPENMDEAIRRAAAAASSKTDSDEGVADVLAQAAADRDADIEALAGLQDDQLYYLAWVSKIEDETTGLECGGI